MEVIFSLIESACLVTCSAQQQARIKSVLTEYSDYVMPVVTGSNPNPEFHWQIANDIANRIAGQIGSVVHSLKEKELIVYRIGELLGNWNRYEFEKTEAGKPINENFLTRLHKLIEQLNGGTLPSEIATLFEKYRKGDDWAQTTIADEFYTKLRQTLIEAEIFKK